MLAFAAQQKGEIEACAAKPGLITAPGKTVTPAAAAAVKAGFLPSVDVTELSVALLDQVVNGFEREPLMNDDLVRMGKGVLERAQMS